MRDVALSCPECGDAVDALPPAHWGGPGQPPAYRHANDSTALCPVVESGGYVPAAPLVDELPEEAGVQ